SRRPQAESGVPGAAASGRDGKTPHESGGNGTRRRTITRQVLQPGQRRPLARRPAHRQPRAAEYSRAALVIVEPHGDAGLARWSIQRRMDFTETETLALTAATSGELLVSLRILGA